MSVLSITSYAFALGRKEVAAESIDVDYPAEMPSRALGRKQGGEQLDQDCSGPMGLIAWLRDENKRMSAWRAEHPEDAVRNTWLGFATGLIERPAMPQEAPKKRPSREP